MTRLPAAFLLTRLQRTTRLTGESIAGGRLPAVVAIFRQTPFQFCQTCLQLPDLLTQRRVLRLQLCYPFFYCYALILADLATFSE